MAENTSQAGSQSSREIYHAVILPEQGEPFVISTTSYEKLADELRKFYGTRTFVFPFKGQRWAISKGPIQRYLLGPNGERAPLFQEALNLEPNPDGSLFTRENTVQEKVKR
jgi:hypothetical protein